MSILFTLLWVAMFAIQEQDFMSKLEKITSNLRDAQHEVHDVKVSHNLTRGTLLSIQDKLGVCSSRFIEAEDKLKISIAQNQEYQATILNLQESVRSLRLESDQKSEALLDFQDRLDRILCWTVWVALALGFLALVLFVSFFSFSFFFFLFFLFFSVFIFFFCI